MRNKCVRHTVTLSLLILFQFLCSILFLVSKNIDLLFWKVFSFNLTEFVIIYVHKKIDKRKQILLL